MIFDLDQKISDLFQLCKGVKQMKAFMRKQIEEHQASYNEDVPPRDFIDIYLAEIK